MYRKQYVFFFSETRSRKQRPVQNEGHLATITQLGLQEKHLLSGCWTFVLIGCFLCGLQEAWIHSVIRWACWDSGGWYPEKGMDTFPHYAPFEQEEIMVSITCFLNIIPSTLWYPSATYWGLGTHTSLIFRFSTLYLDPPPSLHLHHTHSQNEASLHFFAFLNQTEQTLQGWETLEIHPESNALNKDNSMKLSVAWLIIKLVNN